MPNEVIPEAPVPEVIPEAPVPDVIENELTVPEVIEEIIDSVDYDPRDLPGEEEIPIPDSLDEIPILDSVDEIPIPDSEEEIPIPDEDISLDIRSGKSNSEVEAPINEVEEPKTRIIIIKAESLPTGSSSATYKTFSPVSGPGAVAPHANPYAEHEWEDPITHEKFRSSEVGVVLPAVIPLEERDGRAVFRGSASSSIGKSNYHFKIEPLACEQHSYPQIFLNQEK